MRFINIERIIANKYNHLLVWLVLYVFTAPFAEQSEKKLGFQIVGLLLLATLTLCLRVTVTSKKVFWACVSLIALAFLLQAAGARSTSIRLQQAFSTTGDLINAAFVTITIVVLMRNMFRTHRVTPNMIVGGICIYLLIGVLWTVLYRLLLTWNTDAIALREGVSLFYFSFTTLTTLGYGDIVPASKLAQDLAIMEAITGQVYLAIFIARLVGLHIAHELMRKQ
ncbi:MAG: potassium channel family protein [Planctomycetota bacterium]|jgi:hypothetical protein